MAVAAVLGILASVVGLNTMARMRRAARDAEALSMETMAGALKTNILRYKRIPAAADWPQVIASELALPVSRVLATRNGITRLFMDDPALSLGAATSAVRTLPYVQSSSGSIEPVNPRALLVSSIGETLPSVPSGQFPVIWSTPGSSLPAGWSGWAPSGEDLHIERVDLRGLFHRVVLNNLDPVNSAIYSVDALMSFAGQREPAYLRKARRMQPADAPSWWRWGGGDGMLATWGIESGETVSTLSHGISHVLFVMEGPDGQPSTTIAFKIDDYPGDIKDPRDPVEFIAWVEATYSGTVDDYYIKAGTGFYDSTGHSIDPTTEGLSGFLSSSGSAFGGSGVDAVIEYGEAVRNYVPPPSEEEEGGDDQGCTTDCGGDEGGTSGGDGSTGGDGSAGSGGDTSGGGDGGSGGESGGDESSSSEGSSGGGGGGSASSGGETSGGSSSSGGGSSGGSLTGDFVIIPPGSRVEAWFIASSTINLHYADGSLQAREFLREDLSYVFENGQWSRYMNYGPRPPMSGFGALVEQFRSAATPSDARYGATPQAVVEELFTYLYSYGVWSSGSGAALPAFSTGGSASGQQVPTYQVLKDCQVRLNQFANNLINGD